MKNFLVSLILLALTTSTFLLVSSQEEIAPVFYVAIPMSDEQYVGPYNLQVMDGMTGDIIFERPSERYDCAFGLSPNGQFYIYGLDEDGDNLDYHILDLRTNSEILESFTDTKPRGFYWFPDSSGFVFLDGSHEYGEPLNIYQYDIHTRSLSTVASIDSYPFPAIYIAGDTLVYLRHNPEEGVLTVYQLDGQSQSFSVPDDTSTSGLSFSNDGRFLVIGSSQVENELRDFYLLDTSNSEIQTIENATASFIGTWRPDSNQFIYHDGNSNYVLLDVITGETTTIRGGSSLATRYLPFWSSDGRFLVLEIYTGVLGEGYENEIHIYNIESGEYQRADFYNAASTYAGFMRWVNAHEFVYIHTDIGGSVPIGEEKSDIFRYDILTQTKTNLSNTPAIEELQRCPW